MCDASCAAVRRLGCVRRCSGSVSGTRATGELTGVLLSS